MGDMELDGKAGMKVEVIETGMFECTSLEWLHLLCMNVLLKQILCLIREHVLT